MTSLMRLTARGVVQYSLCELFAESGKQKAWWLRDRVQSIRVVGLLLCVHGRGSILCPRWATEESRDHPSSTGGPFCSAQARQLQHDCLAYVPLLCSVYAVAQQFQVLLHSWQFAIWSESFCYRVIFDPNKMLNSVILQKQKSQNIICIYI